MSGSKIHHSRSGILSKGSHAKPKNLSTLDQLKPGQKGAIVRVGSVGAVRRRMTEMGMVRGTPIEVVKFAPLGDPMEVKVKGYRLALRKVEAATITIEML